MMAIDNIVGARFKSSGVNVHEFINAGVALLTTAMT